MALVPSNYNGEASTSYSASEGDSDYESLISGFVNKRLSETPITTEKQVLIFSLFLLFFSPLFFGFGF